MISKILLPGRIQNDTCVGIFLLSKFGGEKFEGIKNARIEIQPLIPEGETAETLFEKGILVLDVGGGVFDHHNKEEKITCSSLIARELGIEDKPSIAKLLAYAERCDFYGQGIISNDVLDKAFGLPGLIISLNRKFDNDPNKVFEIVYELLDAHLCDEADKTEELPKEVEDKKKTGDFVDFVVTYRRRQIKVAMITSDNSVMSGYLRGSKGGGYDVVVIWRTSGHVNIITRQATGVDIRSLAALIRKSEALLSGMNITNMDELASHGRLKYLPQWYFDTATKTLQNGGINPPKSITPTQISRESMVDLLKLGLSEELWVPPKLSK